MPISVKPVKAMTTEELEYEFKELADQLKPINARRTEIDREMKSRIDVKTMKIKLKHFFPTREDRKAALRELKRSAGE